MQRAAVRRIGFLLAIGLSVCAICLPVGSSAQSSRRLLFDEAHNNVHRPAASYAPMAQLLRESGFIVSSLTTGLRPSVLASTDVFVSVSPLSAPRDELARMARENGQTFRVFPPAARPAFSGAEVETLETWVRAGGALLLIVDHPPYAAAAQSLAAGFGVDLRNATAADPAFGDSVFPAGIVFARSDGRIGDHSTTTGVDRVVTVAGASLMPPPGGTVLLRLSDDAVDRYGVPDMPDFQETSAAGRGQAIAFAHGEGRVVIVGEAGMFAASPGSNTATEGANGILRNDLTTARFALNVARWLAGLNVE